MRIARWYCPDAHETFALIPDCLASRVSGELQSIEDVAAEVESGATIEEVAERLCPDIELPGAIRWVRRRKRWVRSALTVVRGLAADLFGGVEPKVREFRAAMQTRRVLVELRGAVTDHLAQIAPPFGLSRWPRRENDALRPKARSDQGESRSIPKDVQDLLLAIKDNPDFSIPMVIDDANNSGLVPKEVALPLSTVHRLLSRHGLMKKKTGEPTQKDHRRFEFAKAGDLWMSDVMHGPAVFTEGRKKRKSYLIAFLDDATRVVPHAAFALSENTAAFMPVLK